MKRPRFFVPLCVLAPAIAWSILGQPSIAQDWQTSPDRQTSPEATRRVASPNRSGQFPALIIEESTDSGDRAAVADGFAGPMVTTVSSLLVVLAIFGGLVWVSRRFGSTKAPAGALPNDVLQRLGSAAIDAKTQVTFLKVGQRILVIGQAPTGDPQTLSEIVDPDEVGRITSRCLGRPEIVGRRGSLPASARTSRPDLAAG